MQHGDPLRQAEHDLHIVLDEEHGHAAFGEEPGQGLDRLRRLLHRKPLRRLIEQQELRVLGQCHRDFKEPLVAMRQETGRAIGNRRKSEPIECGIGAIASGLEHRSTTIELPAAGFAGLGG